MLSDSGIYRVQELQEQLVIGFGDDGMPGHFFYPECRDDLVKLLGRYNRKVIVFDLADTNFIASGMIGLMVWLQRRGLDVRLRNVSKSFRQTLRTLKLDEVLKVEEQPVEV